MSSAPGKRELLLKELDALDKERMDTETRLSVLARQERQVLNAGQPRTNGHNRFHSERDRDPGRQSGIKRRVITTGRKHVVLPIRNHNIDKMNEKEEGETEESKPNLSSVVVNEEEGEATGIEKKPNKKPKKEVLSRNKRMFGSLLGHLAEAQKQLKTDETKAKAKAKEDMETRAAKKMEEYNKEVRSRSLVEMAEQRAKEQEQMNKILKEHEEKEVALLEIVMSEHAVKTREYIRTKTTPALLWIPISHNEQTSKLLEDSKQEALKWGSGGHLVVREEIAINGKAEEDKNIIKDEDKPMKDDDKPMKDDDEQMKTETGQD